ncbi:hypothetical protein HED49_22715 [Ochrobactrum daejeonense]|nr:hypothetical protein [Brucella daejeonensis]NKB80119.1 hypothetical protein [Brucella daejeonensis]
MTALVTLAFAAMVFSFACLRQRGLVFCVPAAARGSDRMSIRVIADENR